MQSIITTVDIEHNGRRIPAGTEIAIIDSPFDYTRLVAMTTANMAILQKKESPIAPAGGEGPGVRESTTTDTTEPPTAPNQSPPTEETQPATDLTPQPSPLTSPFPTLPKRLADSLTAAGLNDWHAVLQYTSSGKSLVDLTGIGAKTATIIETELSVWQEAQDEEEDTTPPPTGDPNEEEE